jgi:predicted HicB family RNase H-like nuclease
MVRTSPQVRRSLAIEAEEQGVSLNMLVNQKITVPAAPRSAAAGAA